MRRGHPAKPPLWGSGGAVSPDIVAHGVFSPRRMGAYGEACAEGADVSARERRDVSAQGDDRHIVVVLLFPGNGSEGVGYCVC